MKEPIDMRTTNEGDPMDRAGWAVFDKDDPKLLVDVLPDFWLAWANLSDRHAISVVAKLSASLLRSAVDLEGLRHQERLLIEWVFAGLDAIGKGESPDEAFAWARNGGRGRPKTMLEFFEKISVSCSIAIAKRENPDLSVEQIIADLAEKRGKSEATLWRWHKEVNNGGLQFP